MEELPRLLAVHDGLWFLEKPSGWVVHPTGVADERSLMSWARESLEIPEGGALSPAHRLDKGTSGIVCCAPRAEDRARFGAWLTSREVHKVYLAMVYGRPHRKGVIRRGLKDGRRGESLEAVTRYKVVRLMRKTALVRARPETGRKHQIRRHMQGLGHAIVGDERYPPRRRQRVPGFPGRLWLHAHQLTLPDGFEVRSPLPDALQNHLALLLEDSGDAPTSP